MSIGEEIKRARKAKGLTLRELEKLSGISNAYISQLENGKVFHPSVDVLFRLSNILGNGIIRAIFPAIDRPIAGLMPEQHQSKHPHTCPVCNGRQYVPSTLYDTFGTSSDAGMTPCRSCNGTGIVWG